MKAVVLRNSELALEDVADPQPTTGQTLVKTLVCGICGSDLHQRRHLAHVAEIGRRAGAGDWIDAARPVIFGHEFCAEILEHGAGTQGTLKPGTRVVAMPFVSIAGKMEWVGISNVAPGGFAERMLLTEALLLPVPNGLPSDHAALVEPMAVGAHAVAEARLTPGTPAIVIGCGPVGLGVIAALKIAGHGPVIAVDFSAARRAVAEQLGADILVDPAAVNPHDHWEALGVAPTLQMKALWAATGKPSRPSVAFECVGVPGLIQSLIEATPPGTQIVVVGACMEPDRFEPIIAMQKQMTIRFVLAYSPDEFAQTLHHIAEGHVEVAPLVTGHVGLQHVGEAFDRLESPGVDVKIMVQPDLDPAL